MKAALFVFCNIRYTCPHALHIYGTSALSEVGWCDDVEPIFATRAWEGILHFLRSQKNGGEGGRIPKRQLFLENQGLRPVTS